MSSEIVPLSDNNAYFVKGFGSYLDTGACERGRGVYLFEAVRSVFNLNLIRDL